MQEWKTEILPSRLKFKREISRLKKEGDRLEYLPWYAKIIAYGSIGGIMYTIAFAIWMIPGALLMQTWGFWVGWTAGDGWMNSPDVMIAVVPGCLALACAGVWVVSWHFSPDASETKKKSAGKKRRVKAGKDAGASPEKTRATPSPPPPPGEETPPDANPPG